MAYRVTVRQEPAGEQRSVEIYDQLVDELDLFAVIAAVNGLVREDK